MEMSDTMSRAAPSHVEVLSPGQKGILQHYRFRKTNLLEVNLKSEVNRDLQEAPMNLTNI